MASLFLDDGDVNSDSQRNKKDLAAITVTGHLIIIEEMQWIMWTANFAASFPFADVQMMYHLHITADSEYIYLLSHKACSC